MLSYVFIHNYSKRKLKKRKERVDSRREDQGNREDCREQNPCIEYCADIRKPRLRG
jgi:hypothetical protein